MPLVSVVIPMRNGEPFIGSTLQSILAQDVDLDVIVVNDGSTDASPSTVRNLNDPRVRMIDGPQRGISAAFNAGMNAARGEFLARCDADDLYPAGRLRTQLDYLNAQPEAIAVCSGFSMIDPQSRVIKQHEPSDEALDMTPELLAGGGRSHICAYLFRIAPLRTIGGCREWFVTSEDADLQFRLAHQGRIDYLPIDAYHYRLHDASITHSQADERRKFYAKCAADFLTQRLAGGVDDLDRGTPPTPPVASGKGRSTGRQIASMLLGDAWKAHRAGERKRAVSLGIGAVRASPVSAHYWINLMKLAIKPAGRQKQ